MEPNLLIFPCVIYLFLFIQKSTCFLLAGMNNGYAIYVWRDGYDPTIPGCSQSDFLNWDKHSKCFTHTWDTHSRRQWLWNTCKVQGREIRKIFLADVHHKLRDGFNAKSCGIPGIQLIKQTLSEGHSTVPGLQVYALFAVSDIDVSEKNLIKHVVWYNDHCAGIVHIIYKKYKTNSDQTVMFVTTHVCILKHRYI